MRSMAYQIERVAKRDCGRQWAAGFLLSQVVDHQVGAQREADSI